jgi:hypothetical protein
LALKNVSKEQDEQIITCLTYLSKMTDFKTDVELQTHIIASDRFRKHFKKLIDNQKSKKNDKTIDYISD